MEQMIQDWGYIILFLYSFGGGFIALAVASVLSYTGDLNIYITLIVAASANFLGDQFLFYMARSNKQMAKQMLQKHRRKVAWAHLIMRKRGDAAVFLQKYIYGIKTMIPLAMGLTKYSFYKFTLLNIFATLLWTAVIGYLSYSLGQVVIDLADEYKKYGIIIAIGLILILAYIFKKIDKK
ncbi:MAG: DedA family protein [Campylobacterota bacterium]